MATIVTRAGKGLPLTWNEVDANFTNLNTDKAELASPTFTGTPAAPTAAVGTNTTQVATTAFVNAEIANDAILKAGGTATGQIKGITPVSAEDLTRKDYVDTMLPKAGGTVTGQIKGITPVSSEDLTRKDYVDGVFSSGSNGYKKFPSGFTIQWGNGTAVGGGIANANFPIAFTNTCLQLVANSISSNIVMAVYTFDATGYTIYSNLGTTGAGTDTSFRWIAVGY